MQRIPQRQPAGSRFVQDHAGGLHGVHHLDLHLGGLLHLAANRCHRNGRRAFAHRRNHAAGYRGNLRGTGLPGVIRLRRGGGKAGGKLKRLAQIQLHRARLVQRHLRGLVRVNHLDFHRRGLLHLAPHCRHRNGRRAFAHGRNHAAGHRGDLRRTGLPGVIRLCRGGGKTGGKHKRFAQIQLHRARLVQRHLRGLVRVNHFHGHGSGFAVVGGGRNPHASLADAPHLAVFHRGDTAVAGFPCQTEFRVLRVGDYVQIQRVAQVHIYRARRAQGNLLGLGRGLINRRFHRIAALSTHAAHQRMRFQHGMIRFPEGEWRRDVHTSYLSIANVQFGAAIVTGSHVGRRRRILIVDQFCINPKVGSFVPILAI